MSLNLKSILCGRNLAIVALLMIPLLYFAPAIFGPVSLMPGDGWTQILGIRVLIGKLLSQGNLPLWNPYIFGGMPLLASIQPGALYPPNWLFVWFSPRTAMNAMVITTYHIALIGSYRLARRLDMDRPSALVTGLIFTFSGFLLAHLGHTNRIAAAAWLPWILLAVENLYLRATWKWVTLGALFLLLQNLAGEFQMTFYTLLVCAAYGLFSLTLREQREHRLRVLLYSSAMAICGALLSAIQVLPAQELQQLGERSEINYEYFSLYSFPPSHLFNLIFPYFYGGAGTGPYRIAYWGQWNAPEMACYVGLLGLMLAFVAVFGKWPPQRRRIVWFWTCVAIVAVLLAFGNYLPFDLNRGLHRVPVYNLFRASARHFLEFSLAIGVLAGLGLNYLTQAQEATQRKRIKWAVAVVTLLMLGTVITYRFLLYSFPAIHPRLTTAHLLTNPEATIPIVMFVLCLVAILLHFWVRTAATSVVVVIVVLLDLASWGFFFEWRVLRFDVADTLKDPPAVTFIKSREPNLNAFRIVSHSPAPYEAHYKDLNFPNVSIVRKLQSINGYDPLLLGRVSQVTGEMTLGGTFHDAAVFSPAAQGFNLLNVKYLMRDRQPPPTNWNTAAATEIRFSENSLSPKLEPGSHLEIQMDGVGATELAIISALGNSVNVAEGTPLVRIKLHTQDRRIIERELQAGRDSAEWAYDKKEAQPLMKHRRAVVAESFPIADFEGHRYLARLPFERAQIGYIELDYIASQATLQIARASLYDAATNTSTPLSSLRLSADRWRKLETFGPVDVYENLQTLPRAWFVRQVEVLPKAEVLSAIQTGKLKDGRPFAPAETALLETEDVTRRRLTLPEIGDPAGAEVKITRYEPQRIVVETRNAQPGFLALSEIYYRGWEARVDGQRVPVERINYVLRGLALSAGEHRIEFIFRAYSFLHGVNWMLIGAALLLLGASFHTPLFARLLARRKAQTT